MHKLVLAFDSFKGSVNASEITEHITKAIHQYRKDIQVVSFPIADGGEGTTEAIARCLPVRYITCKVHGPLMEESEAAYVITEDGTAVIEMAAASGLPLVTANSRNPMNTTTFGTGEMIADALDKGCRNFVLGLGGSATNDAGIGALNALGVSFKNDKKQEIKPIGRNLNQITHIDTSCLRPELNESSFVIACDVTNPFAGENGAAYIYAPQKGASPEEVDFLDKGLQHYSKVILKETGMEISILEGAGAAGGMGGGLLPFLNARLKSGIGIILELLHFDEAVRSADLVFTGEGKIDGQTGMGKALGGVLEVARKYRVPVIALGGCVEEVSKLNDMGFTAVFSIQPEPVTLEKAMQKDFTLQNLERTVVQILRLLS
ncbi:glycerate kinase [uncultured Bacteroides sp.]|uniref:glycerate kinase family protein n=1 Tax=uncultured Bacteroides sp. TaxID=162156 RepID=UPI0025ED278D|nr:glycerate kinase [uncultured Bacteroides sp.]